MKKVIRITENDLTRIVKRVLNENVIDYPFPNRKTISIINNEGKNVDVDCELAQTPEEKKQGLLYRDGVEDNCGVLFDSDRNSAYHMVDMGFPIEMIFINGGQIVEIIKAQPDQKNIVPEDSFAMNLEVKDGFCKQNNISVGNNVLLGDVINESVDKRKEKYFKTMNTLADMGETKRSLGLNEKDVEILTPYVFEGIEKLIKSKEIFNADDYTKVSTGTYEGLKFTLEFDIIDDYYSGDYEGFDVYINFKVLDGVVDLPIVDELGVEVIEQHNVADVLNGSLDFEYDSEMSYEVGYEVKNIIIDIIHSKVPLIHMVNVDLVLERLK